MCLAVVFLPVSSQLSFLSRSRPYFLGSTDEWSLSALRLIKICEIYQFMIIRTQRDRTFSDCNLSIAGSPVRRCDACARHLLLSLSLSPPLHRSFSPVFFRFPFPFSDNPASSPSAFPLAVPPRTVFRLKVTRHPQPPSLPRPAHPPAANPSSDVSAVPRVRYCSRVFFLGMTTRRYS